MNKSITLLILWILVSSYIFAQNSFIKLTDGKIMRVKVTNFSKNGIIYESGETQIQVDSSDLSFVELENGGLMYFTYDTTKNNINIHELRKIYKNDPYKLLEKGRHVYIPISSTKYKETLGRFDLRNIIDTSGMWKVVYTPYEADFILEYYWNQNNDNKCYLEFKSRDGDIIYKTKSVISNRNVRPVTESANNIRMLNDIFIRQLQLDLYAQDIISDNLLKESRENPFNLLQTGRKVYCQSRDFDKVSYFGNLFFNGFINYSKYWQVVSSPKEAEFILTFVYDEKGRDHCYFLLSDRQGNIFYRSRRTKADGEDQIITSVGMGFTQFFNISFISYANSWFKYWGPTERSFLSAKKLFERQMPILHTLLQKEGINNFKFNFSLKNKINKDKNEFNMEPY